MCKIDEIWMPVQGYEGIYDVSNLGRVRSLTRVVSIYSYLTNTMFERTIESRIKSIHHDKYGYGMVNLKKNGEHRTEKVHRLVAKAFIPNPQNKPCVDHINGVRDDNRVENLRWLSLADNNRVYRKEQLSEEEQERRNNATRKKVICIETGEIYKSIAAAAKAFNVVNQSISACVNGRTRTACGLHWEFY